MRPYLGPLWTDSHPIWAVDVFHHAPPIHGIQNTEIQNKFFSDVIASVLYRPFLYLEHSHQSRSKHYDPPPLTPCEWTVTLLKFSRLCWLPAIILFLTSGNSFYMYWYLNFNVSRSNIEQLMWCTPTKEGTSCTGLYSNIDNGSWHRGER